MGSVRCCMRCAVVAIGCRSAMTGLCSDCSAAPRPTSIPARCCSSLFSSPTAYCSWRIRRSEEHTSELQSRQYLVCRLLLANKKLLYQHQVDHSLLDDQDTLDRNNHQVHLLFGTDYIASAPRAEAADKPHALS